MSATPIEDIKAEIYHDEVVEDASRPVYIPDAEAERRVVRKVSCAMPCEIYDGRRCAIFRSTCA